MAWIEPKIDWVSKDYFNFTDYNRIVGNITHLKGMADELFAFLEDFSLGDEKNRLSPIYAREMNDIENALESLNLETYGLDVNGKKTYKANKPTSTWEDYNRIESACLKLYEMLIVHKNALPRLSFTLGGEKGIRV